MTPKNNDDNKEGVHDLLLFGSQKTEVVKKKEQVPPEKIDQDNQIKLVYELKPFGSHYRYSVLFSNQSAAPITELKIRIRYPSFLRLCRSNPPTISYDLANTGEKFVQVKIEFNRLEAKSQKQVNLFFSPEDLEEIGEIRTFVTFVNYEDFVRALNSDPVIIHFIPVTVEPKIVPSSEVSKILNQDGIKKAIKSIGIGSKKLFDEDTYFNQLIQITINQNFQLIAKDTAKKIGWYYGTDLVSGDDILVIGQIVKNKVEWISASKNPHLLVSVLTQLAKKYIQRLRVMGILEPEDSAFDLECKFCGNPLPYFPKRGKSIECGKCNLEQVVWSK